MLPVHLPRVKAPRTHGELLAHSDLDAVGDLLAPDLRGQLLGRSVADLRSAARRDVLAAARRYLEDAGEPIPDVSSERWFVAGHQPELFHPGVWVKNFVLHHLARMHEAAPLNIVVDNDVAKAPNLRVPTEDRVLTMPLDRVDGDAPFEERRVQDEALFASFPDRLQEHAKHWPFRPWTDRVWSAMRDAAPTPLLGERFVRGRRALERSMGLRPLEVSLSRMCETESFAWFAASILSDLPRWVADYNAAVHAYRRRNDIQSKNHPVPDLGQLGAAFEAPFWIWRDGAPRRQRLFAAVDSGGLHLFAKSTPLATLSGEPLNWVAAWPTLARQGLKIRTRALTTTLFSRLLLADVFLHGIGGGKYDEVTDDLMVRFLGVTPPRFLIVTATLLLPFERTPDVHDRLRRLHRLERDLWYNPQRHMERTHLAPRDGEAERLIEAKQAAMAMPVHTHPDRVVRFKTLLDATASLRPFIADRLESVRREIHDVDRLRHREDIHAARDYSFGLYPEEMLRHYLRADTLSEWRRV